MKIKFMGEVVNGYRYLVCETDSGDTIDVSLEQITNHSDSISAILKLQIVSVHGRTYPYIGKFNLLAPKSRTQLSKDLNEFYKFNWSDVIEAISTDVLQRIFQPEPIEQIEPKESEVEYIIEPLVLAKNVTLWYAPGSAGKSFFAIAAGICVESGIDFFGKVKPGRVMYLDWETGKDELNRRAYMMSRGMGWKQMSCPIYVSCKLPLIQCVDNIVRKALENNVVLVIVDSAGPACGGDILSAEAALNLFQAVRQFTSRGIAVLLLTHVSKSERKDNGQRLPIGSVYFENYPRLTWEIRSEKVSQDNYVVSFFCRKSNVGYHPPAGFFMSFIDKSVMFTHTDVEERSQEKTLVETIEEALTESPKTIQELASILTISTDVVRVTLHRMKQKGIVEKDGEGKWRLNRAPF